MTSLRGLWRRIRVIGTLPLTLAAASGPSLTAACGDDSGSGPSCCRVCTTGKACGDACIPTANNCNVGPGCACNG